MQLPRREITFFCLAMLSVPVFASAATSLGDLAAQMQAGQWAELPTANISATLGANGASGMVFGYTDDIQWDPVSQQLLYAGGDHADLAQFITYSALTNFWQREPRPSWMGSGTMHGYDHSAVDPDKREFFHRPFASMTVRKFNIDLETWTSLPTISSSIMAYNNCCVGVDYFPEMGGLVYASVESGSSGTVIFWERSTNTWKRLASGLPMGQLSQFTEYNPVHGVMIFGGGDGSRAIYKLDSLGRVTTLRTAPVELAIQSTIITVDPISGLYLVFTQDKRFYVYDVSTDTWSLQSGAVPIWSTDYGNPVHGVVATPISSHGVNLFVTCDGNNCRVTLYKHSASSIATPKNLRIVTP